MPGPLQSKPAGAAVRALASVELADELDHRAARVDAALCSGPGILFADRAIYHEAARRLLVLDRATELLMRLDRGACPDCGGRVGTVKAERGPDAHHAADCELIALRRALRAPDACAHPPGGWTALDGCLVRCKGCGLELTASDVAQDQVIALVNAFARVQQGRIGEGFPVFPELASAGRP